VLHAEKTFHKTRQAWHTNYLSFLLYYLLVSVVNMTLKGVCQIKYLCLLKRLWRG